MPQLQGDRTMENWNLDDYYTGFDSEAFLEDFKKVDEMILETKALSESIIKDKENVTQKLERYLEHSEVVAKHLSRLAGFITLTMSVDSNHAVANKYRDNLFQKMSQFTEPETAIELWIGSVENIEGAIEGSEYLKAHAFFIEEILRAQKYMLSPKEEAIISQMQNTGSTAWTNYKNKLIATHTVEVALEGEKKAYPLTEVLNMAYASSKEQRKKAYEAEIASYTAIEEGVVSALNAIKGEALTVVGLRGYKSPVHMTLENSRMSEQTLEAMLEAMKESMPAFRKYLRRKAELLGYTKGLPWYEMYAPIIEKEMPFNYEEGKAFVVKNFATFSQTLADYAQHAMDNAWMDVYPKAGKVGGAFCSSSKAIKQSRILLNYGDTLGDVITMAHELGHGFHNYCMNDETALNSRYPMPLAETASTLCETIVKKAAVKEGDSEEKIAIIENELSDCTQVIVDIYSRYLFETAFFEKRKEGYVSVEETKALMLAAQKEAYGEGMDQEVLHPYMWTWKSHYYNANNNFYNFPYAFGLLFAKGLYAQYEGDKENFPKRYEELLAVTGQMNIEDVAKTINIDVSDKAFWQASLQTIIEDIDKFMALTEQK